MTERLHFHFSLSFSGEGNGNPLQCSCLESPRDGGPWWAAIYGVAQNQTWLKRLSSSSSNKQCWASFHMFVNHLCVLGEMSVWVFCPLFDWAVCFSGIELYELLVYFGNYSFVSCFICYYFFPFWGLCFTLLIVSFAVQKLLSLISSHLFTSVFISFTVEGGS